MSKRNTVAKRSGFAKSLESRQFRRRVIADKRQKFMDQLRERVARELPENFWEDYLEVINRGIDDD